MLVAPATTEGGLNLGRLRLSSRYLLSPLAGYTNLPFRRVVRELGGLGLATTDLVNARGLLRGSPKTKDLIDTSADDRPIAFQIYGAEPREMAEAARWLENYGASVIDINMGCPVHKVTRGGGGSALLCSTSTSAVDLVATVVQAVSIPVTVKMRLGWDAASITAPHFARAFESVGVAGVIIHGRTRDQGFGGDVDLDGIRAVVEAVQQIPVIGNGDVRSRTDAERMFRHTGCAGIGIGRGAVLNPWIFAELTHQERTGVLPRPPTYHERLDFMSRHYHLLVEQRGEHFGSLTFRKVANWYCRVLKPGREMQQRLVRLERVADFDAMVACLRQRGAPPHWRPGDLPAIPVPTGPSERW